ncbi:DNA-formamidopyrimidine glycosylase family protein [Kitasatospora purpeofusca]|uniref:Fpg/Nei family DNA glycosylase n=1 Tax=Kitasatospora purpeofusca TaxID=67352 RepID=UPI0030F05B35
MPELPEVEALTAFLSERLTGRVVAEVRPVAISALKTYDPPVTALAGRTVGPVVRHGKFLDIGFVGTGSADTGSVDSGADGLHLVVHLARAGWLRWREQLPTEPPKPGGRNPLALRVRLEGPDGDGFDLTEAGTKKGLAVYVVRDAEEVPGVARLGPDPFDPDFDLACFRALLAGERRRIKGVLRDQTVLAGVGNAYSDEVLHVARMSPYKLAADLSEEESARLFEALGSTLRDAVERSRGLAAGELKAEKKLGMRVHGRTGQPCPVCGDTVREVSFADSSLQYCPTCQTGGKPLADRRLSRLLK